MERKYFRVNTNMTKYIKYKVGYITNENRFDSNTVKISIIAKIAWIIIFADINTLVFRLSIGKTKYQYRTNMPSHLLNKYLSTNNRILFAIITSMQISTSKRNIDQKMYEKL